MLDFFANVQSANATGIPGGGYTYSEIEEKAVTPTHILAISDSTGSPGISIFDVSTVGAPTLASSWAATSQYVTEQADSYSRSISVKNGYAYYCNFYSDLVVLDVTDPTTLDVSKIIYQSDSTIFPNIYNDSHAVCAHPTRDILWVHGRSGVGVEYISTVDISNPASPTVINTVSAPPSYVYNLCMSNDGERLFFQSGPDLYSYGLDASGNITGLISNVSLMSPMSGAFENMCHAQSSTGDNFVIAAYGSGNDFGVVEMGADYTPDQFGLGELPDFDDPQACFPMPWGQDYSSDDIVFWVTMEDRSRIELFSYNATTDSYTQIATGVTDNVWVPTGGNPSTDGWDQYYVHAGGGRLAIYEWDPVANAIDKIVGIDISTTPGLLNMYQQSVIAFAVP